MSLVHPVDHRLEVDTQCSTALMLAWRHSERSLTENPEDAQTYDYPNILRSLEGLSIVRVLRQEFSETAQLWGVASGLRREVRSEPPQANRDRLNQLIDAAREQYGDELWKRDEQDGRRMRPLEVVERLLRGAEAN